MKHCAITLLLCGLSMAQTPSLPEGIRRDEMANLAAASLSATPDNPITGEQVRITLTIANQSQNAARGVPVVLFAGKTRIAATTVDIAGGNTVGVPFSWTPAAAGAWQLTALIDPDRRLVEENRADNVASLDLAVTDAALKSATLAVSDLELINQEGHSTIRARVRNDGTTPVSAPVVFRVQNSIVATAFVSALAPNESTLVEAAIAPQPSAARISAEVNPRFRTGTQMLLSQNVGLANDLRVDALSLHSAQFEASRPRRVTISFRIVNAGQNPITKPFRTRIFPGLIKSGVPTEDFITTPRLAPGETVFVSRTLEAPPAEFDVRVEADVDQVTADQNRDNNVAISHFQNPAPNIDRWVAIGPRRIDNEGNIGAVGALFHLAIDPKTPSTIYVGGNGEGIWKTTDGGGNWQPITDALPTLRSSALGLDPSNPSRLYLVTPDQGLFTTSDAGGSWSPFDTPSFIQGAAALAILRVHPTNPNLLLLTSNDGIYTYHADGAQPKWTLPLNLAPATDVIFDPSSPNTIYATLRDPATGLYISRDAGAHWTKSFGCPGGALPATDGVGAITLAFAGTRMYAAFKSDKKMEVYRTTGTSCQVGSQQEQSWERSYALTGDDANLLWNRIDADPATPNNVYLSGTVFRVSTDGGQSFNVQSGTQPHADHHGLAVDPTAPRNIYVICDGGIYRSNNRGAANSWQFIGDGILNVQFYAFSLAQSDPNLVIGGTQDNGTLAYTGSTVWNNINGGDGATTAIDPTNSQIQYSMNQGPDSMQRRVGTGAWKPIACGIPIASSCFNLFFQLDPTTPTTVLASCVSLFKSDSPVCNRGPFWPNNDTGDPNVWTEILPSASLSGSVLRSAVDPKLKIYYAGTSGGQVLAGPGGANWQTLFSGIGPVSDIKVDFDDPSIVYVSLIAGSGKGRVYRMKRLASVPTSANVNVADITSNLPSGLSVSALAVDRMNPFTIFVGTNQGVYRGRSSNGGATWTWTPYMNGLPLADVREMDVHPMTGVLRVATFGRGAYEVNTGDPVGSLLSASGKISFLRANDLGTGFGPPTDFLDAEIIVQLNTQPGKSFGFQLRADNEEDARDGMLATLRSAFRGNRTVLIDYFRTGIHNGRIIRVAKTN
jgi:photosystem II stability/assembly factor-like uncharacterized protein